MRILFVIPPRKEEKQTFFASQLPVGLGFLMSYTKSNGHEVKLIDYETCEYKEEKFLEICKQFAPRVVGFSCMTPQIVSAQNLAWLVKDNFSDTVTIVGGKHVSALPTRTMEQFPSFDFAVYGEGELTFNDFLAQLKKGKGNQDWGNIDGLVWRNNASIKQNAPRRLIKQLDDIPFPDRDLFDLGKYSKGMSFKGRWRDKRTTEIITARGCPNRCIFCSSQIITQRKVRFRSVENIIAELEECKTKYGISHFKIVDDTFTLGKKRVKEICKWFRDNNMTWSCNARVDSVDSELLVLMQQSGCIGIMFGVESGSPRLLKKIKKGISLEQIKNAFEWSHEAKIPVIEADFILCGHPDETYDDILLSKKLILEIKPHYLGLGTAVPFPGTEIRDIMLEHDLIERTAIEDWENYIYKPGYYGWHYHHFSQEQLQSISKKMIRSFYLSPRFVLYNLKRLRSVHEIVNWSRAVVQFFSMFK